MKVLVSYDSNNSGGSFWLKDEDWNKLEKAGWKIEWGERCWDSEISLKYHPERKNKKPPQSYEEAKKRDGEDGVRWLGTLATGAKKEFNNITEALKEFEELTGQDLSDEGCNCCGPPHSFSWSAKGCTEGKCKCKGPHKDYEYASGTGLLEYLYPDKKVPSSLREAMEND